MVEHLARKAMVAGEEKGGNTVFYIGQTPLQIKTKVAPCLLHV